jgi:hypothetical protein
MFFFPAVFGKMDVALFWPDGQGIGMMYLAERD